MKNKFANVSSLHSAALRRGAHWFLVIAFLGATTYPFEFHSPPWLSNGAEVDSGSIRFSKPGIALNPEPPTWLDEIVPDGYFSIRLKVRPASATQTGPARILTLSHDPNFRNLTIGQVKSTLVVRLRRGAESPNGLPPFYVSNVFAEKVVRSIEVAAKDRSLVIKVDGAEMLRSTLPRQPFAYWDREYRIALGNEHTWNRPWLGELHQAKIETESISINLLDDGLLTTPQFDLSQIKIVIVSSDWRDLLANFLLLLPVGIISARCFADRDAQYVFLLWMPIVILAEALQLFVHARYTSLSDVVLNLAGVTMGAYVVRRSVHKKFWNPHES